MIPQVFRLLLIEFVVGSVCETHAPRDGLRAFPFCIQIEPSIQEQRISEEEVRLVLNALRQFLFEPLGFLPKLFLGLGRELVLEYQNGR